ncbi:MAG: hypothetical protein NTV94_12700 [Planctomycetota bacterium]|nr:hypothetical protein [Planctomycetota bacterium]
MTHMTARLAVIGTLLAAGTVFGQSVTGTIAVPSIDRWNYPFASQPGTETSVPTFAALRQAGFDDRDAQLVVGFNTDSVIPAGFGSGRYAISSLDITIWVAVDNRFQYDGTFDSVTTSYDPAEVGYTVDADEGKPIEIFPVGYRNGRTDTTYTESGAYSPFAPFPPREGVRYAFAAAFDAQGLPTIDISRHVRQHFEAPPLAIAVNPNLTPGQFVPVATPMTFHINLSSAAAQAYVARGFNAGHLRFMVSSLHAASGGPGGGTGDVIYPAFFSKENLLATDNGYTASMTINATAYPGADFNVDGGVDGSDIEAFFIAWESGEPQADFNMDGGVDGGDIEAFFIAWENGGG